MKQTLFSLKRIIRFTTAGRIFIVVTVFLGVLGIVGNNNLLFMVTALLLGTMAASGIVGRSNIRATSLVVRFPEEVYAQSPCAVSVTLQNNGKKRPVFLLEVVLSGQRAFFPVLQPGESVSKTIFVTFPSRGKHVLSDVELSSVFPFKFFIRYWPVDSIPECLVFPSPLESNEGLLLPTDDVLENVRLSNEDEDIIGVRGYTEGDPIKRVHWKSSARTGEMKTRLYEGDTGDEGKIIDLDRMLEGDTERALSIACYMILEAFKSGGAIGMKYRQRVFEASMREKARIALLALLAEHSAEGSQS